MAFHPVKLFLRLLLSLLLLLAAVIIFLPALLSMDFVRNAAVRKANSSGEIFLQLEYWKFGWKKPTELRGLAFLDKESGLYLEVPHLSTSRGLLDLALSRGHLGEVLIDAPRLVVPQPAPRQDSGDPDAAYSRQGSASGRKPSGSVSPPAGKKPGTIPVLNMDFKMADAFIAMANQDGSTNIIFQSLDISFLLDFPTQPITFEIAGIGGQGIGDIHGSGKLVPSKIDPLNPSAMQFEGNISAPDVDLGTLSAFTHALLPESPLLHGSLNLAVNGQGEAEGQASVNAQCVFKDLGITMPNAAAPAQLGSVIFTMQASQRADRLDLESAVLRAPMLQVTAKGVSSQDRQTQLGLTGTIDLQKTSLLLKDLELMTPDTDLQGTVRLNAGLSLDKETVSVHITNSQVNSLVATLPDRRLYEPSIQFEAHATKNPQGDVLLEQLSLGASAGHLHLKDGQFSADKKITLQGSADMDLAAFDRHYGRFLEIPDTLHPEGSLQSSLSVMGSLAEDITVSMHHVLSPVSLRLNETNSITEERIEAHADLVINQDADIRLERLELLSEPFVARIRGSKTHETLNLDGMLGPNFNRLSQYLNQVAGIPVQLTGRNDNPFSLTIPKLDAEAAGILESAELETTITADSFQGYGMFITNLVVPVTLSNGVGRATLSAGINQGQLHAQPTVNFKPAGKVITMPEHSKLIDDMHLNQQLARELFSKIHPVFSGVSTIGGSADLDMDYFRWPLEPARKQEAVFGGSMTMTNLRFGATGLTLRLLELMKVRERTVEIGSKDFDFTCRNGRITCSPMKLKIDDAHLTLAGSMGLDGTLDYVAEVPLTRELIGRSGEEALGTNIIVRLPIRGTADRPVIDDRAIAAALQNIGEQAIKNVLQEEGSKLFKKFLEKNR